MQRRILVLDFDQTITGLSNKPSESEHFLSGKMVQFAKQVLIDPETKKPIEQNPVVLYGCTSRCLMNIDELFPRINGYLKLHPKHILTIKIAENFEAATGLKFSCISIPDDVQYGLGQGYKKLLAPYEKRALKRLEEAKDPHALKAYLLNDKNEYIRKIGSPHLVYPPTGKNNQLELIFSDIAEKYFDEEIIVDFVDDSFEVLDAVKKFRESDIPANITLNIYYHNGFFDTDINLKKTIQGTDTAIINKYRCNKLWCLINEAFHDLPLDTVSNKKLNLFKHNLFNVLREFYSKIDDGRPEMIAAIRDNIKFTPKKIFSFTCNSMCEIGYKNSEQDLINALKQAILSAKKEAVASAVADAKSSGLATGATTTAKIIELASIAKVFPAEEKKLGTVAAEKSSETPKLEVSISSVLIDATKQVSAQPVSQVALTQKEEKEPELTKMVKMQ